MQTKKNFTKNTICWQTFGHGSSSIKRKKNKLKKTQNNTGEDIHAHHQYWSQADFFIPHDTLPSILASVNQNQRKWIALVLPTSLRGGHVERDNLAVCGQREFGGEDLASHSHWAASDLEGLLWGGDAASHGGHRASGGCKTHHATLRSRIAIMATMTASLRLQCPLEGWVNQQADIQKIWDHYFAVCLYYDDKQAVM